MEEKLLGLVNSNPELLDAFRRMVEKEEENESRGYSCDWEWHDVGVQPHILNKLVLLGVIKVTYKSRAHTYYRLVDRDAMKNFLERYARGEYERTDTYNRRTHLPEDLFDCIEGYDDIKKFIKLSLMSDEPVHILLVGPPGTGKTLFLMELERLPDTRFITAGTATKAGIRDIIFEELPRILIIDELDKINDPKDLSALLTWMESGRIIITKHRMRMERRGKGWVFGACNTIRNLPHELLDRFQIFHIKPYTKEQYIRVVTNYLTKRMSKPKELAEYIARRTAEYTNSVREAIRIARLAKTKSDVDELIAIIKKYRE